MELVGAASDDSVDLCTFSATELCCWNAGLNTEFLDGVVNAKTGETAINLGVHVADAVDEVVIGLSARTGHVEASYLTAASGGSCARCQQSQIQEVPRVERHSADGLVIDDIGKGVLLRVDQGCGCGYVHGLVDIADCQGDVDAGVLIDQDGDI